MVVDITNLTDGPGRTPTQVAVYNTTLDPGKTVRVPAELVDQKLRTLEKSGLISIGALPAWYAAAKQRKGKSLSKEEQQKRIVQPPSQEAEVVALPLSDEPEVRDEISFKRKRQRE